MPDNRFAFEVSVPTGVARPPRRRKAKPPAPRVPSQSAQASAVLARINKRPGLNAGILRMRDRRSEFSSPLAATLAGVAVVPEARAQLDGALDKMWAAAKLPERVDEVVVGGGLHAAIYCAVRVAKGFPRPLVIEQGRVGGSFAVSEVGAFYLNSRNRPGPLTVPGMPGALNVIPGGAVQPSDLSGDEYQRNTDLSFCVRATLAMNAHVVTGHRCNSVTTRPKGGTRYSVNLNRDEFVRTNRVVFATGLGVESGKELSDGRRVMTFMELMAAMDEPFPLRGMGRVAVIGAGDSGRTAVEALTGQGPTTRWSVASLDYPERISWYGLQDIIGLSSSPRASWEGCNRSRYKGIGRLLARDAADGSARLTPKGKAQDVSTGYDCAYVDDLPYDCAVICAGFGAPILPARPGGPPALFMVGGRPVAAQPVGEDIYAVGPAAQIPIDAREAVSAPALSSVPENSTALFRYAGRTAALADLLPKPNKRDAPSGLFQPPGGFVAGQTMRGTGIGEREYTVTLR